MNLQKPRSTTFSLILTILFLKYDGKSAISQGEDQKIEEKNFTIPSSPSSLQLLFNDLRSLSNSQNNTLYKYNKTEDDEEVNGFTIEFNPTLRLNFPDKQQTFPEFGGRMKKLIDENVNQTLGKHENVSSRLDEFFVFPTKFLQQTFEAGELGWLQRQKVIDNLWIHNEGADPKSSLGTAFAFNAPNPHALWLSNTSILLEYASRAFLKELNSGKLVDGNGVSNSTVRPKRQTNFLRNEITFGRNELAKVDITPFVPAHEYIAKCGINEDRTHCDPSKHYRTYSGWCNNLKNPSWGKSVMPFDRMLPPVYDDRISVPKLRSVTGRHLPSPRYVSSMVHVDVSHLSNKHTLMFMQFAQFMDHDVTFTPVNKGPRGAILNCRDCQSSTTVHPECWPIPVPATDNYYPAQEATASGKGYCIPFTRSLPGQQHLGHREQINQNSPYLDSSQIYGENYCKAMSLRSGGGMLNVTFNPTQGGKVLMPQITQMKECRSPSGYCFYAGDPRASEQPALAAVHTVFLREHNRISEELHKINPHWSEEKLYQESRRILTAMNQHVIYSEFIPRLIGHTFVNAYGLRLQNEGYYASYDPNCPVTVYNEFSTAAFRFGHSLIRPQLARMDNRYNGMKPHIPLRDGFFNSDMLYKSLMVDEILRGLLSEPMEQMDPFITKEITNHLFEDTKTSFSGVDLIALNLHRGRDHGLQGYNSYRAVCDLKRVKNFQDLESEIPLDVITRLQRVYDHVDDIDLFTGALVEKAVNGGIIGPTMSCIIGSQFRRLRQCDRFWYETNDPLLQFSPIQLAEIRKATLSKIMCDNLDIPSEIQKNAFDAPHNFLNPRLPCNRLPTVRLDAWREKPVSTGNSHGCKIGNRHTGVGESGLSSPCVSCICTPEGTKCASLRITSCPRLTQEATMDEILKDTVCTSQCGLWLGISSNSAESSLSQHNDMNLQQLHPPVQHLSTNHHRFSSKNMNNLFNIINGRNNYQRTK